MYLILGVLFAIVCGLFGGPSGFFFGAAVGALSGILWQQREKLTGLEHRVMVLEQQIRATEVATSPEPPVDRFVTTAPGPHEAPAVTPLPEVAEPQPLAPASGTVEPPAPRPAQLAAAMGDTSPRQAEWEQRPYAPTGIEVLVSRGFAQIQRFLTTGNPVVRIGAIVLFFGVAFLLRYAYENAWLPIELRLAGATLGGTALVLFGWHWRTRSDTYGIVLQGAGVGILYLTIFAAARLYGLLPMELAFVLLTALVAGSSVLAVLQRAQSLAVFAMSGGFIAPVLLSTGAGSHVVLFGYYLLLNAGILAMAWFRAWRWLNWLGFAFTFVIGAAWGWRYYRPELFTTTEPFLVVFYLFYVAVSVLFARREGTRVRGLVDGTLVFGVPLAAIGLQWGLVHDFEFGMAWSALAMAALYLALATWLKRAGTLTQLLGQSFLALAVAFATLAIPFAFDNQRLTGATWALEGVGLLWVGIRQRQVLPRAAGVLLQFAAAAAYFVGQDPAAPSALVLNGEFLSAALIALAGLFAAWLITAHRERLHEAERPIGVVLLGWGTLWWLWDGIREIARYDSRRAGLVESDSLTEHLVVLFVALSLGGLSLLARRLRWREGLLPGYLLLPFLGLSLTILIVNDQFAASGLPLGDLGYLAWPIGFGALYLHLALLPERVPALPFWHAASWWLLALFAAWVVADALARTLPDSAWVTASWGAVPLLFVLALRRLRDSARFPFARAPAAYHGTGATFMLGALVLWTVATAAVVGDPRPLPYVPLLNPLELTQLGILLAVGLLLREARDPTRRAGGLVLGIGAFAWINFVTARALHHVAGIEFPVQHVFRSDTFQTTASILWTTLALLLMGFATRRGQRAVWVAGAVLLGVVIAKLFTVDISRLDLVARIVSFVVVGILMLVIGFLAPLPPARRSAMPEEAA